ncbi:flagellar basal body-associated protein FliL [Shewanella sp. NIFS-20-20]|uniref:flagellar basal body-associated protein FliL n=1 Tax=Shewanella sp. NIFS-20-20 TaxID=2853806 RepID=UPI001C471D91|nr:flagellar basal body-associated protein FliL [Shewanella sp. NIFS-20-20]MBV7314798.1 flagellar basal body-associated protein FliL [Shewanella sp. NIFS-20-20]
MADGLELEEKDGPKKKSKLPLIIIIVVVLLLGGGAAAFFLLGGSDDAATQEVAGDESAVVMDNTPATGEAFYQPMPKPFLFNLPAADRSRLVEIKVQLMGRGDDDHNLIKKHIPLIEDALLSTFSGAESGNLSTQAGKDELRKEALQKVQTTLQTLTGRKVVEQVLFTGFVMQ